MRRCLSRLLPLLGLFCLLGAPVQAATTTLETWIDQADLVCIATPVATQEGEGIPISDHDSQVTDSTTLHVEAVLKGPATLSDVILRTYRIAREGPVDPASLTPLPPNHHYMVFARLIVAHKEGGTRVYAPVVPDSPGVGIESALPVGPPAKALNSAASPRINVVRQLLDSLASGDKTLLLPALPQLGEWGTLFWDAPQPERPAFEPPDAMTLRTLVKAYVLPAVLKQTTAPDPEVRLAALCAAADLQATGAIPALSALARSRSGEAHTAAWALLRFRVRAAAPLLAPLIDHPNMEARVASMEFFEIIHDRRSLPYLLDRLNDPEPSVRERLPYTLWSVTHLPATYKLHANQEEAARTFWKQWAAQHHAEMEALRRQTSMQGKDGREKGKVR